MSVVEPTHKLWDKFYTVYMFDEIKYHKLCKKHPTENRSLLKKQCYVLKDGKRIHLGDERHIYRIKALKRIQEKLADYCTNLRNKLNMFETSSSYDAGSFTLFYERYEGSYTYGVPTVNINTQKEVGTSQLGLFSFNVVANEYKIREHWDYFEVELNGTWQLPIKTRLLLHLEVLRRCKNGESIEDSCKNVLATYRKEDIMK